jgi:hypothetical protein
MGTWVRLEVNKKDESVVQTRHVASFLVFRCDVLLANKVVDFTTKRVFLDDIMKGVYRYVDIDISVVPADDPYAASSFVLWRMLIDAKIVHAVHVPPACDADLERIIEFLSANPVRRIIHTFHDNAVAACMLIDSLTTGNVYAETLELRLLPGNKWDYKMDSVVFAMVFNKKCNIKMLKCPFHIWSGLRGSLASQSRGTWIREIDHMGGIIVPSYDVSQHVKKSGTVKSAMLVLRECASIKRIQNNVGCVVHRLPLELVQMVARFLLVS